MQIWHRLFVWRKKQQQLQLYLAKHLHVWMFLKPPCIEVEMSAKMWFLFNSTQFGHTCDVVICLNRKNPNDQLHFVHIYNLQICVCLFLCNYMRSIIIVVHSRINCIDKLLRGSSFFISFLLVTNCVTNVNGKMETWEEKKRKKLYIRSKNKSLHVNISIVFAHVSISSAVRYSRRGTHAIIIIYCR